MSLRVAIVGCGAISQMQHLPAMLSQPDANVVSLVDINLERARSLRTYFRLSCHVITDYRELFGQVDAVVNALPHHLHAPVTLDLLEHGIHVLTEKPLATNPTEARRCVRVASDRQLVLAVGMVKRFHPSTDLMTLLIKGGELGDILALEYIDGAESTWPSATGFYFRRETAGGGIFLDTGIHIVDRLLTWFDAVRPVSYADDNYGGVEGDAVAEFALESGSKTIPGRVRVTRLYQLQSRCAVIGSKARAEIYRANNTSVFIFRSIRSHEVRSEVTMFPVTQPNIPACFRAQARDFLDAIIEGRPPRCDPGHAVAALEIIDECYKIAKRLPQLWFQYGESETARGRA